MHTSVLLYYSGYSLLIFKIELFKYLSDTIEFENYLDNLKIEILKNDKRITKGKKKLTKQVQGEWTLILYLSSILKLIIVSRNILYN